MGLCMVHSWVAQNSGWLDGCISSSYSFSSRYRRRGIHGHLHFFLGVSMCRIGLQPSLAELQRLGNCAGDAFHYD